MRQLFLAQFEPDKDDFIYRRSQKGEAIRVTAIERERFVDQFERSLRRSWWIIVLGIAVLVGGELALSFLGQRAPSPTFIYAGAALTLIPYAAYYHSAWTAPSRELEGRTPIAQARSRDEVRRLHLGRMTYGQLGTVALAGVALPFLATSDPFSGWSRLWILAGAALVIIGAVQAARKWRLEQEGPLAFAANPVQGTGPVNNRSGWHAKIKGLRFLPLAVLLLGAAFIVLTDTGKQLAKHPYFPAAAMLGLGLWSLGTVAYGFKVGTIEPLVRGFNNAYDRVAQRRRFWASMGWNTVIGSGLLWSAYASHHEAKVQEYSDTCQNRSQAFSPQEALSACDRLIRLKPDDSLVFTEKGRIFLDGGKFDQAIAEFTTAHRLDPKSPWPLANRGLSYAWKNDRARAERDLAAARSIDPENPALLSGDAVLRMQAGDWQNEIVLLNKLLSRYPDDAWSLNMRAFAYEGLGDLDKARADRIRVQKLAKAKEKSKPLATTS